MDRYDSKDAQRRSAPAAVVIYEAIRMEGEKELDRKNSALAWSGVAAGLSMGFSFVVEALLSMRLPDAPWRPIVSKFGYCIGFLIVILGRQQLFTENTLTPILHLFRQFDRESFWKVVNLWSVVLAANIAGAFIFALIIAKTPIFEKNLYVSLSIIGKEAISAGPIVTFMRAVLAGWLIAMLVWLMPFAETARVGVIIIITYVIGLGGFSHVIAGSVEMFYAALTGAVKWTTCVPQFFFPALFGNIIGGIFFVSSINYAQIMSENKSI